MAEIRTRDLRRRAAMPLSRRSLMKALGCGAVATTVHRANWDYPTPLWAQKAAPPVYLIGLVAPSSGGEPQVIGQRMAMEKD